MSMDMEPPDGGAEASTADVTSQQLQDNNSGRIDDVSGGSSPPSSGDGGGEEGDSLEKLQKETNRRKSRRRLDIPNDGCLWQKYGQKHIKGTTITRYYYKCSIFKDGQCPGKRTVEYHKDNPSALHIQYPEKHNHQLLLNIPPRKKKSKMFLNQSENATLVPSIHQFPSPSSASCTNSSIQNFPIQNSYIQNVPVFEKDPPPTNIQARNRNIANDEISVAKLIENRYKVCNGNEFGIVSGTRNVPKIESRPEWGNGNNYGTMNSSGNENNYGNMNSSENKNNYRNMNNSGNENEFGNRNGNLACQSMALINREPPLKIFEEEEGINLTPENILGMENLRDQLSCQRTISRLDDLIMTELIRARIREAENRNSNLTEIVPTRNVQTEYFQVGNITEEKVPTGNAAWTREGIWQMRVEEDAQLRENAISTNFPGFHGPDDSSVMVNETRKTEITVDPFSLLGGRDTLKVADFADVPKDFFLENPQRLTSPLTQDPLNGTDFEDPWIPNSAFGSGEDGREF